MITIYTKDYCPYCVKAKLLLNSLGKEFQEIDITNTPNVMMELVQKSGMRTVPQIYVDDKCLGGYSDIQALHDKSELLPILG
jgi:glutaredoxin 3